MSITPRYGEALKWTDALHREQRRKGKAVPYIAHLIAVSSLVWEDGGNEDQAIAALLHDAIEDAGQSHGSIAERFGAPVADIVRDCTDTSPELATGEKEPWLLRKIRYLESLANKPEASLLGTAADKAHNAGLAGSAWYMLRMHEELSDRLPRSRSVLKLGEAVNSILESPTYQALIPDRQTTKAWTQDYPERHSDQR